jgi:hypothetical protein
MKNKQIIFIVEVKQDNLLFIHNLSIIFFMIFLARLNYNHT